MMGGNPKSIRIATRRSPLALAQTQLVIEAIQEKFPGAKTEIIPLITTGDRKSDWSLEREGGKGLFTKELEDALLSEVADLAVHSAKDLPTENPEGLALAGFLPREVASDVMLVRDDVKDITSIATGSPRRRVQLSLLFPDVTWREIRGNVETRIRKIVAGDADATVLAAAGLRRLGIHAAEGIVFRELPLHQCVPAPGQAAIAVQCRTAEVEHFQSIIDDETSFAVRIERRLLERLGEGCHSACAAHYQSGRLLVFHERSGYFEVPLRGLTFEECLISIDEIAEKLTS